MNSNTYWTSCSTYIDKKHNWGSEALGKNKQLTFIYECKSHEQNVLTDKEKEAYNKVLDIIWDVIVRNSNAGEI